MTVPADYVSARSPTGPPKCSFGQIVITPAALETVPLHHVQRFTLELGSKNKTTLGHSVLSSLGMIRSFPGAHHT